jgi:hypothetical protein
MALYELRTYTLRVGAMAEAVKLYQELGFPALQRGGQDKKLVGYFQADTGMINQLVHLWKFDDDTDRRAHWASVYSNKDFVEGFASKFRPLLMTQEVKLLQAAPAGLARPTMSAGLARWQDRAAVAAESCRARPWSDSPLRPDLFGR